MAKEKTNRWTVRNKKLRAENDFNRVMREYVTYKYGSIAVECCEFYDKLRNKYPTKGIYTGAKKFRAWVTHEIEEYTAVNGASSNSGEQEISSRCSSSDEHEVNNSSEQEISNGSTEQEISNGSSEQEISNGSTEQEISNGSTEQEISNGSTEQEISNGSTEQEISNGSTEQEISNGSTEQERRDQANGNVIEAALELAAIEIDNFIAEEEENGDEGIDLDVWEELQGEIESFDCQLEEELNHIFM